MADATKIPKRTAIAYFKWETPSNPNPRLSQPIGATDTTIYFSVAPKDEDGAVITAPFIFQVTNASGYTEEIYCPNGANGTSGLSATGCVRGILPSGLDYTVGSATYAAAHEQDSPVRCSISPTIQSVIIDALTGVGGMQTGGTGFYMGDGTDSNIRYYFANADGSKPYIGYDSASNQVVISNDGSSSFAPGTGSGAITGGDGITVTAGDIDVDLTDTTVFVSTSSGAGDNGKIARLDSAGELPTGFIKASTLADYISDVSSTSAEIDKVVNDALPEFTAGEAINGATTPQVCALIGGTIYKQITAYNSSQTIYNVGDATTSARRGQSFVITDANASDIELQFINLLVNKGGTPSDNLYIEIQTDSSGAPSGTVVTNGTSSTLAGGSVTGGAYANYKFTFATPPSLTSGTTYWIVARRSGAVDGANYFRLAGSNSSVYSGGNLSTYDSTSGTWSATAAADLSFHAVYTIDYNTTKVMKADADNIHLSKSIGLTKSNISSGGTAVMQVSGVVSGFPSSSFTPGAPYYLSTTSGILIGTMPTTYTGSLSPTIVHQVGEALSDTSLLIRPKAHAILNIDSTAWTTITANSGTADLFIETGFKPTKIQIGFYFDDGTSSTDDIVNQTYFGTQRVDETTIYSLNTSQQTVTAQTVITKAAGSPYNDRVVVNAVYQNGFLLRLSDIRAVDVVSKLYIIAE